jgi:hypothetical protein
MRAQFGEAAILRYSGTPNLRPQGIEDEDDDEDENEAPHDWRPNILLRTCEVNLAVCLFRGQSQTSQRLQHGSQIHNRLIFANAITALGQQPGLNRSQIVSVEHLLRDRVDQQFA